MAFMNLKFYSEALGMQTEVYIVIPQKSTAGEIGVETNAKADRYKCLYLLHGLSDDHSIWLRRTSIERYASEYGICVVMPAAARSFYTDMKYGQKYYTYIAKELPRIIREFLNVSDKREDNFVAGLSMGGYGAMKLALNFPEKFGAAASFSGAVDILATGKGFPQTMKRITGGKSIKGTECDLLHLVKAKAEEPHKPRLYVACGTADFL